MTDRPRRRRRAKEIMDAIAVACVAVAIAVGTSQLVKEGLQQFLFRPPGVGASPSEIASSQPATAAPTPHVAELIPPAPVASPRPLNRHPYEHHGGALR